MSTTTTTTTEGEAGIVEDDPLRGVPRPLQLVRTGDESNDYAFTLDEANLDELISKVPKDKPVAVVSVVGAFRTGKSFLLTLILRYLRHKTKFEEGDWVTCEGDKISEGNRNKTDSREGYSFEWRGGHERMTTGITVWSEPFFLEDLGLAVVVMDTQGLFDHEAPMALTASIFGLSTLVSSFQLYNVATRIQEDNLQHLALFSEYGRMAIREQLRAEATFQKRTEEEEEEEEEPEEARSLEEPDGSLISSDERKLPATELEDSKTTLTAVWRLGKTTPTTLRKEKRLQASASNNTKPTIMMTKRD